jgi:hypothetical protein
MPFTIAFLIADDGLFAVQVSASFSISATVSFEGKLSEMTGKD